eukprot:gene3046-3506_t
MAARWYFTRDQIMNTPSVRNGIEYAKELGYRQQCANFIQDIGQRLTVYIPSPFIDLTVMEFDAHSSIILLDRALIVNDFRVPNSMQMAYWGPWSKNMATNQLCINTSIVYMHRFYMFHSFKDFHRNIMAPCFLFLGAKVEEQPRKLEHVLKVAYRCLHKDSDATLDSQSDEYMQMAQDLIDNESILLQTLGFELSVEHPHTYVVKCAQMVKAAKDLAQTSYFLATNSLHLTTFCIEQKPTVVACVCIYVACKWTSYEIPESHDKKHWWEYMDNEVTLGKIEEMTTHFIKVLDSCPARLKKKITSTGPVIYKGGVLTLKKDNEDEGIAGDKHNGASSSKSSASRDSSTNRHNTKSEHSSDSSKSKERKDHSSSSHSTHKHSKHPESARHSDAEKRQQVEHQKHRSEHKHREHKHQWESSKHDDDGMMKQQQSRKRPDQKDNMLKIPDMKSSSSISRPVEKIKASVEDKSAAEKLILALPPLQHKHSLAESDHSAEHSSPAKKKRLDPNVAVTKSQNVDLDSSKLTGHVKDKSLQGGSHHKHHKSAMPKLASSKDKQREKTPSDKHFMSHQSKQHSSHKSLPGQKYHSKGPRDMSASRLSDTDHSSTSDTSIVDSPLKHALTEQKSSSHHHKSMKTPQKPNTDKGSPFTTTPQKTQKYNLQTGTSLPPEETLPPPPPPPSVDMTAMLSPPPLPQGTPDMFSKQTVTPTKGQAAKQPQYGLQSDAGLLPQPMTSQALNTGQAFHQQSQFINTSQPASMFYQGQKSQTYASHKPSLFPPQAVNFIPPPMPPPGMILEQVSGLPPPPPPLNIPFPPPP